MLGSRNLEPLMQTIDAQCIELDSYKRELMSLTSKQTFFQIEEKIICPKLLIPSLREALDDDYADQVHFEDINSIPLCDIPLKIGQPYLFRHNQCCDHIFLINELRLFDPSRDALLHDNQVLKIYQSRTVRAHCEICEEDFAIMTVMYDQKVQIEEKRVENAKRITLMCERCYELYGKEEQERGRIQTVKYYREAK
ncbi:hypothetical protein FGO68_gene13709 [Halteria grandinella]|uniref:Uncharacterized protein n=1 Tax=Halteria grandinella TaxID=5974 RepID=A0A8J8NLG8_HALGN|nr:hypothetical protein FGO68_gene13709 [Halteria grandinella]